MDKKGLTASYMAVSCSFYDKRMGTAAHAMLHFELLPHTHTGEAIAAVLDKTMKTWKILDEKVSKYGKPVFNKPICQLMLLLCVKLHKDSIKNKIKVIHCNGYEVGTTVCYKMLHAISDSSHSH